MKTNAENITNSISGLTSQNWNKLVPATVGEQAYRETGQFPKVACWGVVASQVVREQSLNKLVPNGMFDVENSLC